MMQMKNIVCFVFLICSARFGQTSVLRKADTCTPTSAGDPSVDDVPSISEALSTCGNGGTIVIPAGKTFMIRTHLDFSNCTGCTFQLEGTLKVSDDLDYWGGKNDFFLIGNVTRGSFHSLTGSGLIDGSGQKYWDYFATHPDYIRPFLIYFSNASHVNFTNIKLKDAAFWFFYITGNSTNIKISKLNITAISTTGSRPANTDGFDTGECSHVSITDIYVHNGDDCVSFKNGSNYITVNNVTCIGSHGLSVGSLGSTAGHHDTVNNVYISNVTMINSMWATRIKFYPGGPSHGTVFVNNVTYKNIIVDNCDYALEVVNCYESNSTTCKTYPSAAKLFNIYFNNITGRTSTQHDPVVARIACAQYGTCDLSFNQWNIVSPSGNTTVQCSNYDRPSGITCTPETLP